MSMPTTDLLSDHAHTVSSGVSAFTAWLRTSRLHIRPEAISHAAEQARMWLTERRAQVAG